MNITYIFSFLVGIFVMSCSSDQTSQDSCVDESIIDEFSVCIEIYQPVCGCDGITYSNSCYATTFNGVTSYSEGSCN